MALPFAYSVHLLHWITIIIPGNCFFFDWFAMDILLLKTKVLQSVSGSLLQIRYSWCSLKTAQSPSKEIIYSTVFKNVEKIFIIYYHTLELWTKRMFSKEGKEPAVLCWLPSPVSGSSITCSKWFLCVLCPWFCSPCGWVRSDLNSSEMEPAFIEIGTLRYPLL